MKRIAPGPGQESVWDYPRPPALKEVRRHVVVKVGQQVVADSNHLFRVLETSHPPVFYIPPADIDMYLLRPGDGHSSCEWKGLASYVDIVIGDDVRKKAGWFYPDPTRGFEPIKDCIAFYPGRVDECTIDDEVVEAQEGNFYGGWITAEIVGPFKGSPGTWGW